MKKLFLFAAVLTSPFFFASVAQAGCSPSCPSGQTCRYEAAGDKYYCKKNASSVTGTTVNNSNGGVRVDKPQGTIMPMRKRN